MDVDLNFDIDAFYREQDKRMNLLDDDLNDYVARMGTRTRSVLLHFGQSVCSNAWVQARRRLFDTSG